MPTILLAGFDAATLEALRAELSAEARLEAAGGAAEVLERLGSVPGASAPGVSGSDVSASDVPVPGVVLCLGAGLAAGDAESLLQEVARMRPTSAAGVTVNVVLAAGPQPEIFEDLVAEDRLFYLCQQPPPRADVVKILRGALEQARRSSRDAPPADGERASLTRRMLTLVQQLSGEQNPARVAALTARAAEQLTGADRGECLLYDPATETLWGPAPAKEADERRESAAAGVTSFVLRTDSPVVLERVGEDPRYDPEIDAAQSDGPASEGRDGGRDRFLAVPISATRRVFEPDAARGFDSNVLAVLKVLRHGDEPPFGARELAILEELAVQAAPVIGRLALQAELEAATARRRSDGGDPLFRREALAHHARGFKAEGHLLHISPAWMPWAYRVLLLVSLTAALFAVFGSVHEYATGPALVRVEGRTEVTAAVAGTVTSVDVRPGERVAAGQLLVRLYGAQEVAELERIEREFELALIQRLRDPADPSTEGTLSALRAERQLAQARLAERSVRAPHAGFVGDVRCRPGEHLLPGQALLSLSGEEPDMAIVALLPGHYRPLLETGMPLRFELRGYRYAYQRLVVDRVGDEVLGPAEARRALGSSVGDAVPLSGSVVLVHAALPERTFESGGRRYEMHDGSLGTVEVRVRSERILEALLPGLAWLFENNGENNGENDGENDGGKDG